MKIKSIIYTIIAMFIISMAGVIYYQYKSLEAEKVEKEAYKANTEALITSVEYYRTESDYGAAKVKELSLTLDEYKEYRAADLKTIKELKVDIKRINSIKSTSTESLYTIEAQARDTIIMEVRDTVKCINVKDEWMTLKGCIDRRNKFTGDIKIKDKIKCIEHVTPKRFLFFKWGVKRRNLEVLSENPHTTITDAEFITIRK